MKISIYNFQDLLKNLTMELKPDVTQIEVFYDGRCGMCCTFHEWINRQQRACQIDFIPYQSSRAAEIFPGIHELDPARAMVVKTDDGRIYRAAEAWVWCLWSCQKHRDIARKLSHPRFLPVAETACKVLAANRHSLSKVFFRRKDKLVAEDLHQMPKLECNSSNCKV